MSLRLQLQKAKEYCRFLLMWGFRTPGLTLLFLLCRIGSMFVPGTYGSLYLMTYSETLYEEITSTHLGVESKHHTMMLLTKYYYDHISLFSQEVRIGITRLMAIIGGARTCEPGWMQRLENVLFQPKVIKHLRPDLEGEKLKKLLLSSSYEKDVCRELYQYIAVTATMLKYDVRVPRKIPFIVGPPGTGKTTLFRKIAEALDIPFIRIVNESKNEDYKGFLLGTPDQYLPSQSGVLPTFLAHQNRPDGVNIYPAIVLFDEMDKCIRPGEFGNQMVRSLFMDMLDSGASEPMVSLGLYNETIPLHKLIIGFAANDEIRITSFKTDETMKPCIDDAFMNRLNKINSKSFDLEDKKKIGKEMSAKIIKKFDGFEPSMATQIRILETIENDKNPGVRAMEAELTSVILEEVAKKDGWDFYG